MQPSQYDKAELAAFRLGFTPKCWGWDKAVELLLAGIHPFDVRHILVGPSAQMPPHKNTGACCGP